MSGRDPAVCDPRGSWVVSGRPAEENRASLPVLISGVDTPKLGSMNHPSAGQCSASVSMSRIILLVGFLPLILRVRETCEHLAGVLRGAGGHQTRWRWNAVTSVARSPGDPDKSAMYEPRSTAWPYVFSSSTTGGTPPVPAIRGREAWCQ